MPIRKLKHVGRRDHIAISMRHRHAIGFAKGRQRQLGNQPADQAGTAVTQGFAPSILPKALPRLARRTTRLAALLAG